MVQSQPYYRYTIRVYWRCRQESNLHVFLWGRLPDFQSGAPPLSDCNIYNGAAHRTRTCKSLLTKCLQNTALTSRTCSVYCFEPDLNRRLPIQPKTVLFQRVYIVSSTVRHSPRLSHQSVSGAHSQARTDDFILTMDALYLLSYASIWRQTEVTTSIPCGTTRFRGGDQQPAGIIWHSCFWRPLRESNPPPRCQSPLFCR